MLNTLPEKLLIHRLPLAVAVDPQHFCGRCDLLRLHPRLDMNAINPHRLRVARSVNRDTIQVHDAAKDIYANALAGGEVGLHRLIEFADFVRHQGMPGWIDAREGRQRREASQDAVSVGL
jgi:hypothetical protein